MQRVRRSDAVWGSMEAMVGSGSASEASWERRKPAEPSAVPTKLPSTRSPSLWKGTERRGEASIAVMIAPRSTLLNALVRSTWTITEPGRAEVKARVAWMIASPPLRIATPN
ncbi:hypothetical protein CLOM_g22508 [Closterium sp. NIES-68]|nr:hypothetical protein CLOM_g22508 [Closterium sp. NIES-68]